MSSNSSTGQSTGDTDELLLRRNLDVMSSMAATLVYLVLLMTLGLVGNVIVLLVYYRRFKPSTTRSYILAMGAVDLLSSAVALPSDIVETRFYHNFPSDGACKFFGGLTFFLAMFGAVILVAVALDRHRKVCGRGLRMRSVVYVRRELASLCVFALGVASPYAAIKGLQTIDLSGSDVKSHKCNIDDKYVGSLFFSVYNGSTVLIFFVCVCTMSVSYGLIGRHIWQLKRTPSFQGRHRRTDEACYKVRQQQGSADDSCDVRVFSPGEDSQPTVDSLNDTSTTTSNGHAQCCIEEKGAIVDSPTISQISLSIETHAETAPHKGTNTVVPESGAERHSSGHGTRIAETEPRPKKTNSCVFSVKIECSLSLSESSVSDISTVCDSHNLDIVKAETCQNVSSKTETSGSDNAAPGQGQHEAQPLSLQGVTDESLSSLPYEQDPANKISLNEPREYRLQTRNCEVLAISSETQDSATEKCNRKVDLTLSRKEHSKTQKPVGAKANPKKKGVKKIRGRTTLMMFVLTATFIVSYLPYIVTSAVFRGKDGLSQNGWLLNAQQIALRSYFINNAVNPFVYGFCSARFRQEVKATWRCE